MLLRSALAVPLVLVLVAATGCSSMSRKFTFMRPNLSKQKFTRTAPTYDVKQGRSEALVARDRLALAEQRISTGQYAEADQLLKGAIKADPKSADAYTLLAFSAEQQRKPGEAGGYYARAAELAPVRGAVLNNYGAWLCGNGRAAESLAWFDRAMADPAYPQKADAQANAGSCALQAGQPARAERDLRAALEQNPTNATALAAMARNEFDAQRYLQARAFSERRLSIGAPTRDVLRLASQIEQKLGDNQASARYLQQMTAQFPQASAEPGNTDSK